MKIMSWRSKAGTTLLTALTPIIWGTTFILASEILPVGMPLTTAAIRTLPAGIVLVLATRSFRPAIPWRRLLVLALLNIAAFQALLFVAAQRLPGGIAALVSALQPLLIVFLVWWIDRHQPRFHTLFASLLGLGGMAVVFLSPGTRLDAMGVLAAFAGSACMAVGTFLALRWRNGMPLLSFIGWKLALGGIVLGGLALLLEPSLPPLTAVHWTGYAYLSLVGTVVAYVFWFRGLAELPPVAVSALGLLSPVTAILLGWLLLDETPHPRQAVGIAVVLTSVAVLQSASPRAHRAALGRSGPGQPEPPGTNPFAPTGDDGHRRPVEAKTNRTNQ
jgi:probable blue pigment (indigoidine) exporter